MKRSRSSVDSRRLDILKIIRQKDEVKVEELAEEFHLSLMTVRRDLQYLEDRKLITRFYGGATARLTTRPMSEGEETEMYRQRIAQFASRFVSAGDTLFINGSSTALDILGYVPVPNVRVFTNNGRAFSRPIPKSISITLTGGEVREHVMVGDYVMRNLLSISADKTFIGCAAISENGEFFYNIPTEIGINEIMISRTSKELYILADHTKLQKNVSPNASYGSCSYERNWTLITDEKADPEVVEKLRELGKKVYVVSLDNLLD